MCPVAAIRIPCLLTDGKSGELVAAIMHDIVGYRISNNEPIYLSHKDWLAAPEAIHRPSHHHVESALCDVSEERKGAALESRPLVPLMP